jgi:enoyl-CoA hydratase
VVEESAVFGVFCRRWGVPLVDGGTVRLPRLIGLSRALDMILTGRPVGAREALSWGLANRVVPEGKAREEAERLALEISSFPPVCMRGDRASAIGQFGRAVEAAMSEELQHGIRAVLSGETVQGALRFAGGAGRHGSFHD